MKILADGSAAQAAAVAAALNETPAWDKLLALQQEIISTLESILAMLEPGKDVAAEKPETASRPAEAPSLQKVADLLGKFMEQQRPALRQTQDLAGKTPENFPPPTRPPSTNSNNSRRNGTASFSRRSTIWTSWRSRTFPPP